MTDIIQELRGLIEKATPGPWETVETKIPWSIASGKQGKHTERRIATTWDHPQSRAPSPVVTGSVGLGFDGGPPAHLVHISEEDAALIVAAINHLPALLDRLEAAEADNAKIRKMLVPQWFYADGYSSEDCCDSPAEALCEFDLEPGKHIRQVDCAGPMPSIWCVVHVLTDEEKDALDTDDDEIITEFASKEEAEAAIREVKP
ncbi:hypothetical protein [Sphingobium sp.]|uniref:hypothetical protein n=1 Tax=Sphingobium sp. TaxID=1912891 RepID=UPI00257EDF72|nr:hypothetical protein [Sphingobium sp.]MBR2268747.1 hypothetical protein [Sphingobium sp.]